MPDSSVGRSATSDFDYSVPLPPAAASFTEGLEMACGWFAERKAGWVLLIGVLL